MRRTIGRRWTGPLCGAGECAVCGVTYSMDKLVKNAEGRWVCSGPGTLDDACGRTALELGEELAAVAESIPDTLSADEVSTYDRSPDV